MIDYIKGVVAECSPTYIVIENNGIGYMLSVSLTTHSQVQNAKGEVKLFVYESIREDAHVLYGFSEKRERDVFELLISVSGVGPNTARMILSSYPVEELADLPNRAVRSREGRRDAVRPNRHPSLR